VSHAELAICQVGAIGGAVACRDIVVIGGSAGSGAVLRRVLPSLPADFPAAVLVATHMSADSPSYLASSLADVSALPVETPADGQPIRLGRIYVTPPDRHMLAFPTVIRLGRGRLVNMARPAIDPLFRSAAAAFGSRVIGLILTGYLSDGAAGLLVVKRRGGLALVQQPLEAEAADMPLAALAVVKADLVLRAEDIASALTQLVGRPAPAEVTPQPDHALADRVALAAWMGSNELSETHLAAQLARRFH
jgi:two-component system, chemotaxis family, protein-glutamate methylesterase/glutaminase